MSRAIIYLRVSTEEQAEKGFSLQAQREECLKKAQELNCETVQEFCDEGISGSILERPMLINALESLKQNDISYFICYDSSRLSRNVAHQLILIDSIKKNGAKLVFIRSSYDDTAEGRFQLTIMAAVDEYERARLKIRTELGKRAKAYQRLLTHNPNIYGYTFDKDKDILLINPEQANVVKVMFKWLLEDGLGPSEIADKLNELGIASMRGKLWNRVTVNRMLRNFSYTGLLYIRRYETKDYKLNKYKKSNEKIKVTERSKDQWIGIDIPPVIDIGIWQRAVDILDKSKRIFKAKNNKQQLLTGLLKCGTCGGTLFGKTINNKNKINRYYCCSNKYNYQLEASLRCKTGLYHAEELETAVWEEVKQLIVNNATVGKLIESELYNKERIKKYKNKQAAESKRKSASSLEKSIKNQGGQTIKLSAFNNSTNLPYESIKEADNIEVNTAEYIEAVLRKINIYIEAMPVTEKNQLLHRLIKDIIIDNNQIIINVYASKNDI